MHVLRQLLSSEPLARCCMRLHDAGRPHCNAQPCLLVGSPAPHLCVAHVAVGCRHQLVVAALPRLPLGLLPLGLLADVLELVRNDLDDRGRVTPAAGSVGISARQETPLPRVCKALSNCALRCSVAAPPRDAPFAGAPAPWPLTRAASPWRPATRCSCPQRECRCHGPAPGSCTHARTHARVHG